MYKKSRVIKIAAAVFCTGVLLGGIGTGVAIEEYTSLEYSGQHILGEENMKTENLDVTVVPEAEKRIRVWRGYRTQGIYYDESVPMNTIRYTVTYNQELTELQARYEEYKEEDELDRGPEEEPEYQGFVILDWYDTLGEFDLLMRNKDKIINELKNGKIGAYQTLSIKAIEIWLNPEMGKFVEFYN